MIIHLKYNITDVAANTLRAHGINCAIDAANQTIIVKDFRALTVLDENLISIAGWSRL